MDKKGFTLIELVMVIVIIGILAAVAIPRFVSLRDDARKEVCRSNVGTIRTALSNFYSKCNVNVSNGGGCPDGVACNITTCFPDAAELSGDSAFGKVYFSDGKLPANTFTGTAASWADAYNASTGHLNITQCCG
jgi:prepilin-type N-terminal cleavage/methylation domain-containing protein